MLKLWKPLENIVLVPRLRYQQGRFCCRSFDFFVFAAVRTMDDSNYNLLIISRGHTLTTSSAQSLHPTRCSSHGGTHLGTLRRIARNGARNGPENRP